MNISTGYLTQQIQLCVTESLSVFVEYSGNSRTGWPFCDKAFTFGCSQKAAEAGGNSNQSLPTRLHHPFQVSYWSTSGQKSYVYFLFFLTANFWWKIEFDAQGQDGKLGKIAYFPPSHLLLLFLMNDKIRYLWEMVFYAGYQALQFRIHQFMFTARV